MVTWHRCGLCCFITENVVLYNKHIKTKKHFNRFINPSAFPRRNKDFFTNNIAETLINDPNHHEHELNMQIYNVYCNNYSIPIESLLAFIDIKQSEPIDPTTDYNQEKSNPVATLYYRILLYYKRIKYLKPKKTHTICFDNHLGLIQLIDPLINSMFKLDLNYNDVPYIIM